MGDSGGFIKSFVSMRPICAVDTFQDPASPLVAGDNATDASRMGTPRKSSARLGRCYMLSASHSLSGFDEAGRIAQGTKVTDPQGGSSCGSGLRTPSIRSNLFRPASPGHRDRPRKMFSAMNYFRHSSVLAGGRIGQSYVDASAIPYRRKADALERGGRQQHSQPDMDRWSGRDGRKP